MKCARCNRKLTREPVWIGGNAIGPVCARAMFGAKAKRERKTEVQRDERTADLFAEAV